MQQQQISTYLYCIVIHTIYCCNGYSLYVENSNKNGKDPDKNDYMINEGIS